MKRSATAAMYSAWISGRQLLDDGRAHVRRHVHAVRDALGELVAEPVREDRAEDRDADRAADLAGERRAGRGDAEQPVVDGVLRREHEHLHHHPEAEAEDQHVHGRDPESASKRSSRLRR